MRIIIVEDHQMFREVLHKICTELDQDVVAEAQHGIQAVELIRQFQPELVLLDLQLPRLDGFEVIASSHRISPGTRILVLSSHCDDATVYRLEHANVQGFVDKNTNVIAVLKDAIRSVVSGQDCFSTAFQRIRQRRLSDPRSFDKILGDREQAIVTLLAIPLNDDAIAERLGIAKETVEKHRRNILRKLDLSTPAELLRYAHKRGFSLATR